MSASPALHLAVALDGAGWHPAAWREPGARADELFTAGLWVDRVRRAQDGLLDFATFEDAFALQSTRSDQVRGWLDAVLLAARVAPLTRGLGLVPTATTTQTEPFHVSTAIATLDFVSGGRGGWLARASGDPEEASTVGPRAAPVPASEELLYAEAGEHVEVVRRLWDSWEDGAEIRDRERGRFVDRDRLHYVDAPGPRYPVRGPSITPRPPQGQPLVAALASSDAALRFAAASADVVFVTAPDPAGLSAIVATLRAGAPAAREDGGPLVFADLLVALDARPGAAAERLARLDALDGGPLTSDAPLFAGTATALADELVAWQEAGAAGVRLRPAALAHDLDAIVGELVPVLQTRGAFRGAYEEGTLRERLGLARPANRYAAAVA